MREILIVSGMAMISYGIAIVLGPDLGWTRWSIWASGWIAGIIVGALQLSSHAPDRK